MQPPTCENSAADDPLGPTNPTGLLVSVRSLAEARAVAASPVEVIDLKEPDQGPLGACDPALWHRCHALCPFEGAWSAALGEFASAVQLASQVPPEFAFAKAGPSGLGSPDALASLWRMVRQRLAPTTALVAVAYADFTAAGALPPEQVLAEASRHRLQTLLVDTFVKDGRTSVDHLGVDRLRSLVAAARRSGCDVVLAGGVTIGVLPVFVSTGARRIGVRGGVCHGNRRSEIDPAAVAHWTTRLEKLTAPSAANWNGKNRIAVGGSQLLKGNRMDRDPPRSSSPPRDASASAVVWTGDLPTGPVRLPEQDAAGFVAEFNRTYAAHGWIVTRNPSWANEKGCVEQARLDAR